ncbi:hypothetical protein [Bradyrhizobium sp. USDA 4454]
MKETVDHRLLAAIDRLAKSSREVAKSFSTMLSKQDIANEHLRKLVTAAEMYGFDEFIRETNYGVNRISYSGQQAACVLTTGA